MLFSSLSKHLSASSKLILALLAFVLTGTAWADPTASVSFSAASVYSGNPVTLKIQLSEPAPTGGVSVAIAQSKPIFAVPSQVAIPAGQTQKELPLTCGNIDSDEVIRVTGTLRGLSSTASIQTRAAVLFGLTAKRYVLGGTTSTGTVTLFGTAGPAGASVTLASNIPALSVPTVVAILPGARSADFTMTTRKVETQVTAELAAKRGTKTLTRAVDVVPVKITDFQVFPATVIGGQPLHGVVRLGSGLPLDAAQIDVTANSSLVESPIPVRLLGNPAEAWFLASTRPTGKSEFVTFSVSLNGTTVRKTVRILAPDIDRITAKPTTLLSGNTGTFEVFLKDAAPAGGVQVTFRSDSPNLTVPVGLTIPEKATSATFTGRAGSISTVSAASVIATANGASVSCRVSLSPAKVLVTVEPAAVTGGVKATGTVQISTPAPAGGQVVALTSSDKKVGVPAEVRIPAGERSANFTIATLPTASVVYAKLTATAGEFQSITTLKLLPPAPDKVSFDRPYALTNSSLTGKVTLTGAAPDGISMFIESDKLFVTPVSPVAIPKGARSVTFTVTTGELTAPEEAKLTFRIADQARSANLGVYPPYALAPTTWPTARGNYLGTYASSAQDLGTGRILWQTYGGDHVAGSAIVTLPDGGLAFATGTNLVTLNSNGTVRWLYRDTSQFYHIETPTALADGSVISSANWNPPFGDTSLFKLSPAGGRLWRYPASPTPARDDGIESYYVGRSGNIFGTKFPPDQTALKRLDPAGRLLWTKASGTASLHQAVEASNGTIYSLSKADPETLSSPVLIFQGNGGERATSLKVGDYPISVDFEGSIYGIIRPPGYPEETVKFTSAGEVAWKRNDGIRSNLIDRDGSSYGITEKDDIEPRLVKLSSAGEVSWKVPVPGLRGIVCVTDTKVIYGHGFDASPSVQRAYIVAFGPEGNVLWKTLLPSGVGLSSVVESSRYNLMRVSITPGNGGILYIPVVRASVRGVIAIK